ncbi:sigma-70 family RNA polymerase sigma factor [Amaricoccus sp.]|uniref:sigma-70 family RNA polymerase sigma factor n=1 Tax=Amaricoccus sp. TaxID=1872485 RepID=UPI001B57B449|nr:sigma-70 family RNA polymerase sigma factor [Amaricoccus sp.]MBP7001144.1 sigma-70 family RNA polymerase sigma factor [Amaricoccus sp.]
MGRETDPPLEDLLRAANRGDARAYAAFLAAVAPMIRAVARARGGALGPETCEDVVQETLLALHDKRRTWREDAPVRPWLFAIVRHKVVDAFRARGRRVHVDIADFADALPAEPGPDPTERRDAERMIGRLDPRSARIVRAIGLDGASVPEVGAALGMSEGAVRVALHRALRRLAALRGGMVE